MADTSVVFDHCEVSVAGTSITTDGRVDIGADGESINWDLDITSELASSGVSSEGRYHQSGELRFGEGAIRGVLLSELSISVSYGSSSFEYEMSEALLLDITYQANPLCVVGGTLEARRVWTSRPDGLPASSAPDRAVLIEWTGCNQATIATST